MGTSWMKMHGQKHTRVGKSSTNKNKKGFQYVEKFSSTIFVALLDALTDDLDHAWKKSLK
jgi:hypothetical protein